MPNFDGTGPRGKGPLTGRGMGRCGQKTTSPKPVSKPSTPKKNPKKK